MKTIIEIFNELNDFVSVSEKLNHLSKYHLVTEGFYKANYGIIQEGKLHICQLVSKLKNKHFPDLNNNVEFSFWFLKWNAQNYFDKIILDNKTERRLESKNSESEIKVELEKIEIAEKVAEDSVIKNKINPDNPYKNEKGYLHLFNNEHKTKVIRRVLNDYYEHNPTEESYTVPQNSEVEAYARHVLFKEYLYKLSNKKKNKNTSSGLDMIHVALIYSYKNIYINYANMKQIASEYGFTSPTSGNRLLQQYNKVHKTTDRKGSQGTPIKDKNRIKAITKILPYLDEPSIKEKAKKEILSLENAIY